MLKLKWVACSCLCFAVVSSHGLVLPRVCAFKALRVLKFKRSVRAFKTPSCPFWRGILNAHKAWFDFMWSGFKSIAQRIEGTHGQDEAMIRSPHNRHTQRQVERKLRRTGVPTKVANAKTWQHSALAAIIRSDKPFVVPSPEVNPNSR